MREYDKQTVRATKKQLSGEIGVERKTEVSGPKCGRKFGSRKALTIILFIAAVLFLFGATTGRFHQLHLLNRSLSPKPEKTDEWSTIEAENMGQTEGEVTKEVIRKAMETRGYSESQIENTVITVTDALHGIMISQVEPIEEAVGKGIRITGKNGAEYDVYIDKSGNVFGIKDLKTGDYIYAAYE